MWVFSRCAFCIGYSCKIDYRYTQRAVMYIECIVHNQINSNIYNQNALQNNHLNNMHEIYIEIGLYYLQG